MKDLQRTRIKCCGMTRVEDALAAAELGADAVGMIFAESPRCIKIAQARAIVRALGPFVTPVGVFVNPTKEEVLHIMDDTGIKTLQFHGNEDAAFIQQFQTCTIIKTLHIGKDDAPIQMEAVADAHLCDTFDPGLAGGTGRTFDHDRVVNLARKTRLILSGGLTPDNVGNAIHRVRPYAVDASSGLEFSPGIKDTHKMTAFIQAVKAADSSDRQP